MLCRDSIEEDFWKINWEAFTIISALKDGLSMANKQHDIHAPSTVRSSEGIYKSVEHRSIPRLLLNMKL